MKPRPLYLNAYVPEITLSKEARTIAGRITVFDTPTDDYRRLVVHEGALQPRLPLANVKLLRDHDQTDPVGYMLALDGDQATFKIPEGENGDRALAEAEAKLRDGLSVGIQVLNEPEAYMYDEADGSYHVYKASLVEVSLCAIPAFNGAQVSEVNAAHHLNNAPKEKKTVDPEEVETLTRAELDAALSDQSTEFERTLDARLATIAPSAGPATAKLQWETPGDFLKAIVAGDPEAIAFHQKFNARTDEGKEFRLAYTGGTSTDGPTHNTWIADAIKLVATQRKVVNTFTQKPLPPEGLTLEYATLLANTVAVGKQAAEGDDLTKGKVTVESKTTNIATYGGWSELSLQQVQRGSVDFLNVTNKAQTIAYGNQTETAARTFLGTQITAQRTAGNKIDVPNVPTLFDYLDAIVEGAELFETRGFNFEGCYVDKATFKSLYRLTDSSDRMVFNVWGTGQNVAGEISVTGLQGELANVPVKLLTGAAANTVLFYDSIAMTTFESPGAPLQLQDDNIVNLTKQFSVYGFAAWALQFPGAIIPLKYAAA